MENYIATTLFNTLQKRYTVPLCTQHDVLASAWVDSCVYPTIDGFDSPQVICNKIFSDSGKEISFVVDNPQDLLLSIREFKQESKAAKLTYSISIKGKIEYTSSKPDSKLTCVQSIKNT